MRRLLSTRRLNIDLVASQFNACIRRPCSGAAARGALRGVGRDPARHRPAIALSDRPVGRPGGLQLGYAEQSTLTRCGRWFDAGPTGVPARGDDGSDASGRQSPAKSGDWHRARMRSPARAPPLRKSRTTPDSTGRRSSGKSRGTEGSVSTAGRPHRPRGVVAPVDGRLLPTYERR